jgi:hypothetical protein
MCRKARAAAQALQRGCHVPHGDAYKRTTCHSFPGACCFYVRRVGGQATHVYTHTVPAPGHAGQGDSLFLARAGPLPARRCTSSSLHYLPCLVAAG